MKWNVSVISDTLSSLRSTHPTLPLPPSLSLTHGFRAVPLDTERLNPLHSLFGFFSILLSPVFLSDLVIQEPVIAFPALRAEEVTYHLANQSTSPNAASEAIVYSTI